MFERSQLTDEFFNFHFLGSVVHILGYFIIVLDAK